MRNKLTPLVLLVGGVLLFALAVLPITASAVSRTDNESTEQTDSDEPRLLTTQEQRKQRLTGDKLRRCQMRDKVIFGLMQRSTMRTENHAKVFGTIAERVKAFYEKNGKTVANYDTLVAAVDAAKAKLEADVLTLKSLDDFSCGSDDPKGDAEAYKTALRVAQQDLKEYRTAVKNLIAGVRSVQNKQEGEQ